MEEKHMYYWEKSFDHTPDCGSFEAKSDEEALQKMPQNCIILYREHETQPQDFVILWEDKNTKL